MKKFVVLVMVVVIALCGFTACGKTREVLVYMPDGAPSLSLANLVSSEYKIGDESTKYRIVSSDKIGGLVATNKADLAILPLNLASKICGENYQILSVMTFGNLYVVGKSGTTIRDVVGHSLHVININNVPGLMTQILLNEQGIPYSLSSQTQSNIKLIGSTAPAIIGGFISGQVEYALVAEPAVSKMLSVVDGLKVICDVQEVVGEYPQSVLVIKKNRFSKNAVEKLCAELSKNTAFLANNTAEIYNIVAKHFEKGVETAFQKELLTADLISRCNVDFRLAINEKQNINDYIVRLKEISNNSADNLKEGVIYDDF